MSIKRGDRMYVRLAAIGECNADGKSVLSFGYSGKAIGEPDRPISTLCIGFVEQVAQMARYSSDDALKADLAAFREYVESLQGRCERSGPAEPQAVAGGAS